MDTLKSSDDIIKCRESFRNAKPFNHVIIDNFFEEEYAEKLSAEFPQYDSGLWHVYDNAIEHKKTSNDWNKFPSHTYRMFEYLNSFEFIRKINLIADCDLHSDPGLHGGGWHIHGRGGKLNVHLDYDIHPKMGLQRRLNLIIYMTKDWNSQWGGGLELWEHDEVTNGPKSCSVRIENRFNRAVLFDTTQNSWHGLPEPLNCPSGVYRKSFATYYLHEPFRNATQRKKALFAPYKEQLSDQKVLDLIKQRVDDTMYEKAYRNHD